jgi:hypothetical protein
MPLDHGVSGVADHGEHAFLAEGGERRLVGARADQGVGIELPVAGVQHDAGRSADHQRLRLRHRVCHVQKIEAERAELERPAGWNHP